MTLPRFCRLYLEWKKRTSEPEEFDINDCYGSISFEPQDDGSIRRVTRDGEGNVTRDEPVYKMEIE